MTDARAFRGFRFPAAVILGAVRWYLQFPLSYRDLERMLADRGVQVDHVSLFRWVQRFAPELEKCLRRHLRPCRGPWHVDVLINGRDIPLPEDLGQTVAMLPPSRHGRLTATAV